MRTDSTTVTRLRHVAVPAQYLQVFRVAVLDNPPEPIRTDHVFSIFFAVIVDMVERQERHTCFTTASTLAPIVHQNPDAPETVAHVHLFTPAIPILWDAHPCLMPLSTCGAFCFSVSWLAANTQSCTIVGPLSLPSHFTASLTLGFSWARWARKTTAAHACFLPLLPVSLVVLWARHAAIVRAP